MLQGHRRAGQARRAVILWAFIGLLGGLAVSCGQAGPVGLPAEDQAAFAAAKARWNEGRVADTRELLGPLWARNGGFAAAGFLLARVAYAEKRPADALALFEKVSAIQPDNLEAVVWRAQALMQLGRDRDAEALVGRALEANPDEPRLSFIMATIYERKDNIAGALGFLRSAGRLEEDLGLVYLESARLEYRFGQLAEARRHVAKAQAILPETSLLMPPVRQLAGLLSNAGHATAAESGRGK